MVEFEQNTLGCQNEDKKLKSQI